MVKTDFHEKTRVCPGRRRLKIYNLWEAMRLTRQLCRCPQTQLSNLRKVSLWNTDSTGWSVYVLIRVIPPSKFQRYWRFCYVYARNNLLNRVIIVCWNSRIYTKLSSHSYIWISSLSNSLVDSFIFIFPCYIFILKFIVHCLFKRISLRIFLIFFLIFILIFIIFKL